MAERQSPFCRQPTDRLHVRGPGPEELRRQKGRKLLEQRGRDRSLQLPGDAHRALGGVGHVAHRAEDDEGIPARLADEEEEAPAVPLLLDVSPAGGRVLRGRVLRLPVEVVAADRVVAIARGVGEKPPSDLSRVTNSSSVRRSPSRRMPSRWLRRRCGVMSAHAVWISRRS